MDWGTTYVVEAEFLNEGRNLRLNWQFTTKPAPENLIKLKGDGEWIWVQPHRLVHLFHPPTEANPLFPQFQTSSSSGVKAVFTWVDWNTLAVEMQGTPCGWVKFRYPPLRGFGLRLHPAREGAACPQPEGD